MAKELVVSATPHETKVAIVEDGQAAEVYVEREKEYGLVGSIYKGRVTRVLPGMQSAFVDVGLDRDAFLYVSDFVEDTEEYDAIVTTVEEKVAKLEEQAATQAAAPAPVAPPAPVVEAEAPPAPAPVAPVAAVPAPQRPPDERPGRYGRGRRPRRHGKGFPESKYASPASGPSEVREPVILPGESLAKYKNVQVPPPTKSADDETISTPSTETAPAPAEPATESAVSGTPATEAAATPQIESPSRQESESPGGEESMSAVETSPAAEPDEAAPTVEAPSGDAAPIEKAEVRHRWTPPSGHLRRPRRRPRRPAGSSHGSRREPRPQPLIADLLREGQEIIVQIVKEPLGKKGARITSHIALPGRYLVYMPTVDHIGVSRKITSEEERVRLRRMIMELKGMITGGFIVRTAADGRSEEELRSDIQFLSNLWTETRALVEKKPAPALLHRDLNLIERILRDQLSSDYTAVWIDNEEEFTKILDFVGRFQPSLVGRVKLYTKPTPIFDEFGIQAELDKALRPKVWLKSGGYIVINHTEALVAIDVNTGKYVGKSARLEDTIVRTNLDAVKEIARQIRLRDLGGIIIIDFIDMEERKNRMRVMQALEEALRSDRAPSKVLSFNEFGLVAITRKRVKQSLERILCQPCPYCTGTGMVKSVPTICYEVQAEARKMASEIEGPDMTIRVNPEIAKAFKTREAVLIEELEQLTRKNIIVQADPALHFEHFDIY